MGGMPPYNDAPYELKSIEFDAEKRSFKVNGRELGNAISGFCLSCDARNYVVQLDLQTKVRHVFYDMNGKRVGDYDKLKP